MRAAHTFVQANVRTYLGCFVDSGNNKTGLMHVSEIVDEDGLDSITDTNIKEGLEVEVLIAEVNPKRKEFKLKPTAETLSKIKVDSELEDVEDVAPPEPDVPSLCVESPSATTRKPSPVSLQSRNAAKLQFSETHSVCTATTNRKPSPIIATSGVARPPASS